MAFAAEDLFPTKPVLILEGREIEYNLLSLRITVKLTEMYGSVAATIEHLKDNSEDIIKITWLLVSDKAVFDNSFDKYSNELFKEKDLVGLGGKLINIFNDIVLRSFPSVKNRKRQNELRKIREEMGEDTTPCYAAYYDTLAHRYGYTLDQFYDLTLRSIHILLTIHGDKTYEELEVQAALAGKKLNPRLKPIEIDEEKDDEMDKQAAEMLASLQKKYKDVNNG